MLDAAKLSFITIITKFMGYSARFCDKWHENNDNYFVESRKECIFAKR